MAVGSSSADLWDSLFYLYLAIALLVGGAVIAWLLTSLVKYRWRPGDARPKDAPIPGVIPAERGHVLWVYIMTGAIAAIMFGLAFSTISAVEELDHAPVGASTIPIDVYGSQFTWTFYHTSPEGVPFREIGELTVPEKTPIATTVRSDDVWHNFALPNFKIRVDAIPGEVTHLWFNASEVGEDHSVCVMLCGSNHATMRAALHVVSRAEYDTFYATRSAAEVAKYERDGAIAHLTLSASGVTAANATVPWHLVKGKTLWEPEWGGILLNVTNSDSARHTVHAGDVTLDLAPGATQRIFVRTPPGELDIAADHGKTTITIKGAN